MKRVLDVCCGGRMFYFDKQHPDVVFADIRRETGLLTNGQRLTVAPEVLADFRALPFADGQFRVVVFDPPHLTHSSATCDMTRKYGRLDKATWPDDLRRGFAECFRVLLPDGVLIFKWCEQDIPVAKVLALTDRRPLLGHRSGKAHKTHWIIFLK
ncbi:MAG: class I SAM-dependent methyltransferase [Verrucomicrobiales bacterium]|jgi:SAM-dependent methyltransferase|nr:class I SAM-dependent methyltransferase [Verrucomicrobiales bacterium]